MCRATGATDDQPSAVWQSALHCSTSSTHTHKGYGGGGPRPPKRRGVDRGAPHREGFIYEP